MVAPLRQDAPSGSQDARSSLPDGYTLDVSTTGRLLKAAVRTADGAPAATGQAGLTGGYAIFDQIATEPGHRRKGLGGAVMSALSAAAAPHGATTGVLVATAEGRALYRHLGWQEISAVTAAHVPQEP
jgi:GNAT superfamily N-acetyltransferase